MTEPSPLIVFADDWGRHPSSCQHLIRHLLPRRRVTWVNTIGTRPPRFDIETFKRGIGKLKQWIGFHSNPTNARIHAEAQAEPRNEPEVRNPRMWPSFQSRFGRGLNRRLLTRALNPIEAPGSAPVFITTLPLMADLVGRVRAARWVYYCVDDFSVWPGLDGRTMRTMEAELVTKVDTVIAVSETLQAHLASLGRSSHLLTHGVDLEFWQKPTSSDTPLSLQSLNELPGPLVVFWGVLDGRMDPAFVRALSETMNQGTILLAGPQQSPDPGILRCKRVRTLPPVPFADLPALAARTAVLIAPYADLPVTRTMQPLKLKEYIATGKPVVVRALPATKSWSDCVDLAETPDAFVARVHERLHNGVPPEQQAARVRLNTEGWAAKSIQFEQWLDEVPSQLRHATTNRPCVAD